MPDNMTPQTDRRIIRTKQSIINALAELMQTRPLENITVTELSAKAGINRKTFYTYYGSPVEVIDEYLEHISNALSEAMHELQSEINVLSPNVLFLILEPLFTDNPFKPSVLRDSNMNYLYKKVVEELRILILDSLSSSEMFSRMDPARKSIIAAYISSGMISVYDEWLRNRTPMNLEEVTGLLSSLIISGLSQFD